MALARIITRSQACSKELALDLIARGYAVEVISPDDAVPDNIADLELRVDTAGADRLTASVEVHDGERLASLEFLHHLKAPMADLVRRTPGPVIPAVAILPDPVVVRPQFGPLELDRKKSTHLKSVPDPLPLPMVAPPGYFAVEEPTITMPANAAPMTAPPRQRDRSAGWFWRAALTFAGVVLVALVLGFGMRRAERVSEQSFGAAPAEKVAAASNSLSSLSNFGFEKDPENNPALVPALAMSPPAIKSGRNSGALAKGSRPAKAGKVTGAAAWRSRGHGNGLIARDTVVYLDERYKPASKAKSAEHSARRHPRSRKHGGVVAASTVTYLNKPAVTATK
jgi:hypothetical protein